jgi:hypothetical protein
MIRFGKMARSLQSEPLSFLRKLLLLTLTVAAYPAAHAAEHITLKNGFELDCVRRETDGERVRLYLMGKSTVSANYLEVASTSIISIEPIVEDDGRVALTQAGKSLSAAGAPRPQEISMLLARAGEQHHIDADMLASVVRAESGGHAKAVSRTGARGLMQLMPGTAAQLGVVDSFEPEQNIKGGAAYLDQLLVRYHDNIALALAAYNAGPGAVDRWHGIPPYRETQLYVARVITEFNRRKQLTLTASSR